MRNGFARSKPLVSPARRGRLQTHAPTRTSASDEGAPPAAQLLRVIAALQESIDELKSEMLMLTRKVVSLQAELDYVQEKSRF